MSDYIKAYRNQKMDWDELREQRVFKAITEKLNPQPIIVDRTRYIISGVGIAAAVLALVTGVLFNTIWSGETEQASRTLVLRENRLDDNKADEQRNESVLTLAGVGQVTVDNGADVSILEQRKGAVYLEQTEGRAMYDIVHQESRSVKVRAAGIVVTVVGTVFWVTVDDPVVRVEVERGVVEVDDGKQVVTLEANETISMGIPEKKKHRLRLPKNKRRVKRKVPHQAKRTEDLFSEADRARKAGDLKKAADILRRIISEKESRYSVASAKFVLGKVERGRGNHAKAAEAFYGCSKQAPNRALGEDALAEAAFSYKAAGNKRKARRIANAYLKDFPEGIYTVKMRRLLD